MLLLLYLDALLATSEDQNIHGDTELVPDLLLDAWPEAEGQEGTQHKGTEGGAARAVVTVTADASAMGVRKAQVVHAGGLIPEESPRGRPAPQDEVPSAKLCPSPGDKGIHP